MALSEDQAYSLLVRKLKLERKFEEARRTINGTDARMEDVVDCFGTYSERAVRAFASSIVSAYNACEVALWHLEFPDEHEPSSPYYLDPDTAELPEEGSQEFRAFARMGKEKTTFLKNLVYCMVRLVSESPFCKGLYSECAANCTAMIAMLEGGPTRQEFVEGVARRQLREGPREAVDATGLLAARHPFAFEYGIFPQVEWADDGVWPEGAFFPDLDAIYELLGGKPIDALATKASVRSAMKKVAADVQGEPKSVSTDENDPLASMGEFDSMRLREEEKGRAEWAKSLAEWADGFPRKDAWCKAYASVCKAYFELLDLGPVAGYSPDFWNLSKAIAAKTLACAFDTVLDDKGISHFTDDVFDAFYDGLSTATVRARRTIVQRRDGRE